MIFTKIKFTLLLLVISANFSFGQSNSKPLVIGEQVTLHSEVLGEDRLLNVYLPEGYHPDSLKKYPVIYLLDGSMDEDFLHIAGLVQFCSFSWINILPETIVIGISNVDRKRDFTFPTTIEKDLQDFPTTGHSAEFIQFIEKELQPFVSSRFNVSDNKTLIGQSLGGLLATEILSKKSYLFNSYIIISPSLWWDNQSLLDSFSVDNLQVSSIFIGVGSEGSEMERTAKLLYKICNSQGKSTVGCHFEYFKDKNHGDVLHQAVYNAFMKISLEK